MNLVIKWFDKFSKSVLDTFLFLGVTQKFWHFDSIQAMKALSNSRQTVSPIKFFYDLASTFSELFLHKRRKILHRNLS